MRTLYLDCGMGAAGDMLTAALVELFDDPGSVTAELNQLGGPGVTFFREESPKCGITGTHMKVLVGDAEEGEHHHHHDHHPHSGLQDIEHIISHLMIPDKVRRDVTEVYRLIAQAESHVHGVPMEHIHFHEVGTMDAVADVTAVCYLLDRLGVEKVIASPIHVGSGQVKCAHGVLPVPAPATACLLKDVPIYGGEISGELCTPTGAALLKHFASEFGAMPVLRTQAIGYGMGKKDFPRANCVRALLGETRDQTDSVLELSCNLDDMTAEELGFAMERLLEAGALDVFTQPIGMKKSRPGTMLTVLCREEGRERMVEAMFRHTTTLGIRQKEVTRCILQRSVEQRGDVRVKIAAGYGVRREKPEYEDIAAIAREKGLSIREVRQMLTKDI